MKIQYCVSAIGYDKSDCVTDYEKDFGDPTTLEEAKRQFALIDDNPKAYLKVFPDFGFWMVQLEKCRVTKNCIECIDVVNELDIYEEDLK